MNEDQTDLLVVQEAREILDQIAEGENERRAKIERYLQTHRHSLLRHLFGLYRRHQVQWTLSNQKLARLSLCQEGLKMGQYQLTIQILEEQVAEFEARIPEARRNDEELNLSPQQGLANQYQKLNQRLTKVTNELRSL